MIGIVINLISTRVSNVKNINDCLSRYKNLQIIYICQLNEDSFKLLKNEFIKHNNIYFELASKNLFQVVKIKASIFLKKNKK